MAWLQIIDKADTFSYIDNILGKANNQIILTQTRSKYLDWPGFLTCVWLRIWEKEGGIEPAKKLRVYLPTCEEWSINIYRVKNDCYLAIHTNMAMCEIDI